MSSRHNEVMSIASIFNIMHEHLEMKKIFGRWVPFLLTFDQKQRRVSDLEAHFELGR